MSFQDKNNSESSRPDKTYLFTPPVEGKYYAEDVSRIGVGIVKDGKFTGKIKTTSNNNENLYPTTIDIAHDVWHKTHNHPTYNAVMVDSIEVANVTELKHNIGDVVSYKNGNGVRIGDKTIVGIEQDKFGPRYYIEPTDTPWFSVPENHLKAKKVKTNGMER